MNKRRKAKQIAQHLLDDVLPGAFALLAEETDLPIHSPGADLILHVFDVPEGENTKCMKLLLNALYRSPFSEDDFLVIHSHSLSATREHYSHIKPNPERITQEEMNDRPTPVVIFGWQIPYQLALMTNRYRWNNDEGCWSKLEFDMKMKPATEEEVGDHLIGILKRSVWSRMEDDKPIGRTFTVAWFCYHYVVIEHVHDRGSWFARGQFAITQFKTELEAWWKIYTDTPRETSRPE